MPSDNTFRDQLYLTLNHIPAGRVVTYSGLARRCGNPNGARWVARLLANLPPDTHLPWHRVINAQGKISFPVNSPMYERQYGKLKEEGIQFHNNRINLAIYDYT